MGLFNIVKNNDNSYNKSTNKKHKNGKYVNFDMNQLPQQVPMQQSNGSYLGTYDSNMVNLPTGNSGNVGINVSQQVNIPKDPVESRPVIAPTGAAKQKNFKHDNVVNDELTMVENVNDTQRIPTDYDIKTKNLDPMNNGSNEIPVNPVAPLQEELVEQDIDFKNVKANLFSVIGMIMGMTFKPGTTIINSAKKYRSSTKALIITAWITALSLALSFIVRILVGSFAKSTSVVTGEVHLQFNPAFLFSADNYIEYLAIAFLVSAIAILVISLVYYSSSFVNSKGVPLGSYITISNLSMLPFIMGVVALYPIGSLFSKYIGVAAMIFTFLYSLMAFCIGMNRILTFKNIDRQILYNVINLSIIIMIMIIIVIILIRADILTMPDLII